MKSIKDSATRRAVFFTIFVFLLIYSSIPIVKADPNWLSGWSKRIQLTIDSDDVDEDMTYFPVLIKLSDSSGINGTDVTCVFDEVESNYLKIAVTKSDGTTELYVEIEDWNNVTELAYLWISKSDWIISNSTDTIIYLYYDNEHADNNDYVGIVNSVSGKLVWNPNYRMVLHLSEDGEPFIDSTSYNNDASSLGTVTPEDNFIDGTLDLAGTNDYLRQETAGLGSGWDDITFESWVRYDNLGLRRCTASAWGGAAGEDMFNILYYTVQQQNRFITMASDNSADLVWFGSNPPNTGEWYYYVGVRERDSFVWGYENAVETQGDATPDLPLDTYTYKMFYGQYTGGGLSHDGNLDEIRLSNTTRSANWIETTYETDRDELIYYGEEEIKTPIEMPNKLFGAGFNDSSPYVDLYWKSNLTDITLFEVQNSTDKITWEYLGQNTTTEYHDYQVVNGLERYYRVRSCNLTDAVWDNSTWSDIDFEKVYFIKGDGGGIESVNMNPSLILVIFLIIVGISLIYSVRRRR